jgi:hypothetical protein
LRNQVLKAANVPPGTNVDRRAVLEGEPFSYRATKSGTVLISWNGKTVTTLKGKPAEAFLAKVEGADTHAAQLVMAKATGHFKHGNERSSRAP